MRSIRINRAKWRAGDDDTDGKYACGIGSTLLVNSENYMCCLGFAAQQLSHKSKKSIRYCGDPSSLKFVVSPINKRLKDGSMNLTELSDKAIDINDCETTALEVKEKKLIKLFARHDLELEFFGDYTKPY